MLADEATEAYRYHDLFRTFLRRHLDLERPGAARELHRRAAAADLYPLFPNPVLAEGFLDRLLTSAYIVTMLGRSYRPRQRPGAAGKEVLADDIRPT